MVEPEEEVVKKSTIEEENKQLGWFLLVILIVFAAVLIPYFWAESNKSFQYSQIDWFVESDENPITYHGRFPSLGINDLNYNIFLREDPRKNKVPVVGNISTFNFKNTGIITMTPEIDACRGELPRAMFDISAFVRQGIGIKKLVAGSTDKDIANESQRVFARCDNLPNRTIIVFGVGEQSIVQDEENPYCYYINIENCDDISPVEKFMVQSIKDSRTKIQ